MQEVLSDKYYADVYTVNLSTKVNTKLDHQAYAVYDVTDKSLTSTFNVHQDFDFTYIKEPMTELVDLLAADYVPYPVNISQSNFSADKIQNFKITHVNMINHICEIKQIDVGVK